MGRAGSLAKMAYGRISGSGVMASVALKVPGEGFVRENGQESNSNLYVVQGPSGATSSGTKDRRMGRCISGV